ncbi:MAG: hypothetical protein ACI8W9_002159, partial [Psychromonas sp.]
TGLVKSEHCIAPIGIKDIPVDPNTNNPANKALLKRSLTSRSC